MDINRLLRSRILLRHDTVANWELQPDFVPEAGEVVIYDDYEIYSGEAFPNFKVGDGIHKISVLPFVHAYERQLLTNHLNNTDIHVTLAEKQAWDAHLANTDVHVTSADKEYWNNKVNVYDTVENEQLIIIR